jgi:primosomal protein N' (replication factor Y)
MWLLDVLIEHASLQLDRPFSYSYDGFLGHRRGFRVLVTFNHQTLIGYVLDAHEIVAVPTGTSTKILPILSIIDQEPLLNDELMALAISMALGNLWPRISVLQAMLPKAETKKSALKGPKIAYEDFVRVVNTDESDLT